MQRDTNLYVRTYMVKKYFLNMMDIIYDGNNFYEDKCNKEYFIKMFFSYI